MTLVNVALDHHRNCSKNGQAKINRERGGRKEEIFFFLNILLNRKYSGQVRDRFNIKLRIKI